MFSITKVQPCRKPTKECIENGPCSHFITVKLKNIKGDVFSDSSILSLLMNSTFYLFTLALTG